MIIAKQLLWLLVCFMVVDIFLIIVVILAIFIPGKMSS